MRGMGDRSDVDPVHTAVTSVNTHDGCVRELHLGGTRGNLITAKLVDELRDALHHATADNHIKLIIITGENGHFSYGADVSEHLPDRIARVLPAFHELVGELLACDIPIVARVSGYCLGGGFEIALACSMIWCAEDAKLGLPEISLGVFPPVAAILLPCKTSHNNAAEMVLTGKVITAADAHAMGIANNIGSADELDAFVVTYILSKSGSSLRHANAALHGALRKRYHDEIAIVEKLYLDRLMRTHDAVEGALAFLDKRVPDWRNE